MKLPVAEFCSQKCFKEFWPIHKLSHRKKNRKSNKWGEIPYRYVEFPLIKDNIQKDTIYNYWNKQNVRFAYRNNCVGCVNRKPLFLSHIAQKDKERFTQDVKRC